MLRQQDARWRILRRARESLYSAPVADGELSMDELEEVAGGGGIAALVNWISTW